MITIWPNLYVYKTCKLHQSNKTLPQHLSPTLSMTLEENGHRMNMVYNLGGLYCIVLFCAIALSG